MNILLVTMSMKIGGAETHVLELSKGLKKRGYNVYVMSNGGEYVPELEANGIEHINAPLHNKNIINMIKSYKLLSKTILDKKIDVVHVHARIPGMIANYVCKKLKIPLVATTHGIYKVNPLLKLLTSWGEKTVVVSDDVKKYVVGEYGVDEKNVAVTVNGIDLEKFNKNIKYNEICKEFSINSGVKKIVHVSRLDSQTSIVANMLIDIAQNFDNTQFIIVGSGTEYENLKKRANEINNKFGMKRIILTGARTDINKFLSVCDIFAGVSRAALEAMSTEKPVILAGNQGYLGIFNKNNLDEALKTNFCCRGLEMPTIEKLTDDIGILLNISNEENENMGVYNRKIVQKYYSIDKMVKDAENMYVAVVKKI